MKEIDLKHSQIQLTKDEIVIIRCKDDHQYEINEVQELITATGVLTKGKKLPTLTIPGKYTQATKEALDFIFSPGATIFASYDAFIAQSLSQKIIGNFYLNVKKPDIPTRLFSNEKSAIQWLKKSSKSKLRGKPN